MIINSHIILLIILQYTNMGCEEYDHFPDIIMVGYELNPK